MENNKSLKDIIKGIFKTTEKGVDLGISSTTNIDDDTTVTSKISESYNINNEKMSFGLNFDNTLSKDLAEGWNYTLKDSAGVEFKEDSSSLKNEVESRIKHQYGDNSDEVYSKAATKIDSKNGLEVGVTTGEKIKRGNVEASNQMANTASFDGKNAFLKNEVSNSVKIGDENFSQEFNSKHSEKIGTDGSHESSTTVGQNTKVGKNEYGTSYTSTSSDSSKENDQGLQTDTHKETEKMEASAGTEVSDGVKVKQSVGVEETRKTSDNEKETTEEEETKVTSKTRIEVDSEKAGVGMAVAATAFNLGASMVENAVSEATKETNKETTKKDQGQQALPAAEEQKALSSGEEKEAQAQQEAQAEAQEYDYYAGYGY